MSGKMEERPHNVGYQADIHQLPAEIVCKNRRGETLSLTVRRCRKEDLCRILELQELVLEKLTYEDLFVRTSAEEIGESLTMDFCAGAYADGQLILFTLMIANRMTPRNLGTCLQYEERQLLETVTYDTMFVHPDHRGFGLQDLAIRLNDAEAVRLGAKEALATISPENSWSLHNAKANGFQIIKRQPMYRGIDRYIVRKEFCLTTGI